jgi:hypothetical protein
VAIDRRVGVRSALEDWNQFLTLACLLLLLKTRSYFPRHRNNNLSASGEYNSLRTQELAAPSGKYCVSGDRFQFFFSQVAWYLVTSLQSWNIAENSSE